MIRCFSCYSLFNKYLNNFKLLFFLLIRNFGCYCKLIMWCLLIDLIVLMVWFFGLIVVIWKLGVKFLIF